MNKSKVELESAVFRPQIGYYNNIAEAAAALMESPANHHPFLDGNKRVAFAAAHTFLLVNGHDLEVHPLAAYDFMMQSIAKGEFRTNPQVDQLPYSVKKGLRGSSRGALSTLQRSTFSF